ncbi:SAM-dependent methyltransferase [Streptomyces broussonetiae]|uniref:Methyltransferase domain-containing protein n=1 Tax=Streptomyces broussonetiae TaxID=2686304 RepID=A0ABV5ECV5_9ACTN
MSHTGPTAERVGDYYDKGVDLFPLLWDENIHMGYWTDETDDSSVAVATDRMTGQLIDRLAPRPGQRILDVGCGLGKPAVALATAHPVHVVGVTISPDQAKRATERARGTDVEARVTFRHGDGMALPFDDDSFDGAWAFESLLHMEDKPRALRELARVLRPGSRLVLADMYHRPREGMGFEGFMATLTGMDDYRELLADAGFSTLEALDITAHTVIPETAFAVMKEAMLARRGELAPITGEEAFEAAIAADRTTPPYTYVLITAHLG